MEENKTLSIKAPMGLESVVFEELNLKRLPIDQGEFELNIKPIGTIFEETKKFQLNLYVELTDENKSFEMSLMTVGIFNVEDEGRLDPNNPLFYVNAPAIIFPYIRAYVASITSLSGLKSVNLPLMNLSFLKDEIISSLKKEKIQEDEESESPE